jgi:hypothetical protein
MMIVVGFTCIGGHEKIIHDPVYHLDVKSLIASERWLNHILAHVEIGAEGLLLHHA